MARVRSPGDSDDRRPGHVVGAQAELGQQRAGVWRRPASPLASTNAVEQRSVACRSRPAPWSSSPTTTPGPEVARPRVERQPAEQRVEQRGLAAAVRAERSRPARPSRSRGRRARARNVAALAPRRRRGGPTTSPLRARRADLEAQLPALPRLVDHVEPLERPLGGADLGRLLLGARPSKCRMILSLSAGFFFALRHALHGPLRAGGGPGPAGRARGAGRRRRPPRRGAGPWPARRGRPPSRPSKRAARWVCSSSSSTCGDRPLEEGAVVADTTTSGGVEAGRRTLEPVEAVEVEVVGGLVEQEHVEAGQQDGGQRGPGGLRRPSERRSAGRAVGRRGRGRPTPRRRGRRGRRRRGRATGRGPRRSGRRRPARPRARASVAACSSSDAAATPVRRASAARTVSPSTRSGSWGEVADGRRRRRRWRRCPCRGRASPARIRSSVVLPVPFGPDDADAVAGRGDERDRVEHDVGPVGHGEVAGGEGGGHGRLRSRSAELVEHGRRSSSSSPRTAAPPRGAEGERGELDGDGVELAHVPGEAHRLHIVISSSMRRPSVSELADAHEGEGVAAGACVGEHRAAGTPAGASMRPRSPVGSVARRRRTPRCSGGCAPTPARSARRR